MPSEPAESSKACTGDRPAEEVIYPDLENQLRIAGEENEMLQRENESLRSLAQGGGELAVPQEMIDRVEKEFGLRFLSSPVVHRIAGEELRDRIAAAIESRFGPAGVDDRQESYKSIGWLRPDDDLLAQLTAVRAVGALGWFDDVTGEGWVTDRFDLKNIPDQAALLRLLVRVLFHQHFPPPPAYPGDDAARAREALHQGAAAGSEARFYAANARTIGFMPMKENTEAAQLMASLSPFLQGLTTFPITDGKAFADTLYVRGNDALHAAFRSPPQTTRAIFFPAEPASEPMALDLPEVPEEPFLTETGGELGLRLWLAPMGDVGAALEIASSWKNDRYLLFPDGESSSAVLWDIELENSCRRRQAAGRRPRSRRRHGRLGRIRHSRQAHRFTRETPPPNHPPLPHPHSFSQHLRSCHRRRTRVQSLPMIAKKVIFEGRVQGVGFRYTVKDLSRGFEVCGWVKNLPDGSVELQVMGETDEVESFIKEIAEESNVAHHIKNLTAVKIALLENCNGFRIER